MTDPEISEETLAALPGVLADIARLAGLRAALELAAKAGGSFVFVPKAPSDGRGLLVRTVGLEAATSIAAEFGGENLEIPLGPTVDAAKKRARIRELLSRGVSVQAIARQLHCHNRTVRRERNKTGAPRPVDLFSYREE